jgi:colicin import membrane protein
MSNESKDIKKGLTEEEKAKKAAADKAAKEKADKEAKEKREKEEQEKAEKEATKKDAQTVKNAKLYLDTMDRVKTDKLYKNSKGELFSVENLADLSEGGKKDKVKTLHRDVLEALVAAKK